MIAHFRKRCSEVDLNRINELITKCENAMVIEAVSTLSEDDVFGEPDADAGNQLSHNELVKPADWPEGKNLGTLTTDASCTPAVITYPTDLKLLIKSRVSTERIIDDLCDQRSGLRKNGPDMIVGGHALFSSISPCR